MTRCKTCPNDLDDCEECDVQFCSNCSEDDGFEGLCMDCYAGHDPEEFKE